MYLPERIENMIKDKPYTADSTGQSGAKVILFDDMVLKVQPASSEIEGEVKLMEWLENKLPVPKCLCHTVENGTDYLLMSRIKGKMACDSEYMRDPQKLTEVLAEAMKNLWSVDISDCPVGMKLETKLKMAENMVKNGCVDVENAQPDTFGKDGFENSGELLRWLSENQPEEDIVLSHGDFCLPNILLEKGGLSGFIDIGRMGLADRWNDIAICYRSLKDNYTGKYAAEEYDNFDPDSLFKALGVEKNEEKLRYYILLDELF